MNMLRNKEFRREAAVMCGIWAVAIIIGLAISVSCGLTALIFGGVMLAAFAAITHRRYRRMAHLADDISRILHGDANVLIDSHAEGELSVLQSEIAKMTQRLNQQNSLLMEDRQHLTAAIQDMFHQIRTPLTALNLMVSMLGDEDLPPQSRGEIARSMRGQLERTRWLVETLLKMSKLDGGTAEFSPRSVAVDALIRKAAAPLLIPMELKGQRFTVQATGQAWVDKSWTCEALSNILKNAVEHTPEGGQISITGQETALYTQITISDDGPGIDKEDLPHIFERFYRGQGGSVGIGLSFARSVIAAQRGTVSAANNPQGGARFSIRFYKSVV